MTGRKLFRVSNEMLSDSNLEFILEDMSLRFEKEMIKGGFLFLYTSYAIGPFLHSDDFVKNRWNFYRDYFYEQIEKTEDDN